MNTLLSAFNNFNEQKQEVRNIFDKFKIPNFKKYKNDYIFTSINFVLNLIAVVIAIMVYKEPRFIHIMNFLNFMILCIMGYKMVALKPFLVFKFQRDEENKKKDMVAMLGEQQNFQLFFNTIYKDKDYHPFLKKLSADIQSGTAKFVDVEKMFTIYNTVQAQLQKQNEVPQEDLFEKMVSGIKENSSDNEVPEEEVRFFQK